MESKTLSKVEQLKGLVDLRDNPYHQFVEQAAEVEVQALLDVMLSNTFPSLPDCDKKALAFLGEMRGLRGSRQMLATTIATLTEEVNKENGLPPKDSQSQQQIESEV